MDNSFDNEDGAEVALETETQSAADQFGAGNQSPETAAAGFGNVATAEEPAKPDPTYAIKVDVSEDDPVDDLDDQSDIDLNKVSEDDPSEPETATGACYEPSAEEILWRVRYQRSEALAHVVHSHGGRGIPVHQLLREAEDVMLWLDGELSVDELQAYNEE